MNNYMNKTYLAALDLQIELSKIIDNENRYQELLKKKRDYLIDYILEEEKEKEIDYFEDERDTES